MYEIEKGIPLPPSHSNAETELGRTLEKMVPGDSIRVGNSKVAQTATNKLRALGWRITWRKLQDGSYRLWCLAKEAGK